MSWGISEKASEIEKIKSRMNDELQGMNSCCEINYETYSELFDITHKLLQEAYELGLKEGLNKC